MSVASNNWQRHQDYQYYINIWISTDLSITFSRDSKSGFDYQTSWNMTERSGQKLLSQIDIVLAGGYPIGNGSLSCVISELKRNLKIEFKSVKSIRLSCIILYSSVMKFLFTWHWFLIEFNVMQNYIQKFILSQYQLQQQVNYLSEQFCSQVCPGFLKWIHSLIYSHYCTYLCEPICPSFVLALHIVYSSNNILHQKSILWVDTCIIESVTSFVHEWYLIMESRCVGGDKNTCFYCYRQLGVIIPLIRDFQAAPCDKVTTAKATPCDTA